jgi:hypothetical protein
VKVYVCPTLLAVRARLLALSVALAALAVLPAGALADGDPASDVLISSTLYTPVAQKISPPVLQQLQRTIEQANAGGFQVRVALILDRTDLGAVPQLYGNPTSYVRLLSAELFYVWKGAVIAVQPSGIGVANIKPLAPAQAAANTIKVAKPATADALAQAATTAIRKIAPMERSSITFTSNGSTTASTSSSSSSSTTTRILGGVLIVVFVLLFIGQLVVRRRRRTSRDA